MIQRDKLIPGRARRVSVVALVACLLLAAATVWAGAGNLSAFQWDPVLGAWIRLPSGSDSASVAISQPNSGACDKENWYIPITNHLTYTGGGSEISKTAVPQTSNIRVLVPGTSFQVDCFERAAWLVTITVDNVNGAPITDVTVDDRFGGEYCVALRSRTQGTVVITASGTTEKPMVRWTVGTIPAGGRATLVLRVSTDHNPAGKQEFTTPGVYTMNSGAVLKYYLGGVQQSRTSDQLQVTAVVTDDLSRLMSDGE